MGYQVSLQQTVEHDNIDIAVIGGGASGVAVVLQLVEQIKNGKSISNIVIVEKSTEPGPGLAFSAACSGTILNMHSDTMGIYQQNLMDYTNWRGSLEDGPFPSRVNYGNYLQDRLSRAIDEAKVLGTDITVIKGTALEISREEDGRITVVMDDTSKITAKSTVLALGNFSGTANAHLVGCPGYFENPWPTSQLTSIPSDSHVIVIGSRLSAVDAAIFLSENGHKGPITFMSRSGKLPKVQGDPIPFKRRHVLYELARELENGCADPFLRVTSVLVEELSQAMNGDWSWVLEKDSSLEQLESDLRAAQNQQVRWQSVLSSTAPLVERYWNCLSAESQQLFMTKFNATWMAYRHAMPIKNAQKILRLLKRCQLRVVRGDTITWDHVFIAKTSVGDIEAPYVIAATGQESHVDRIDAPLVRSAIQNGLLSPHAIGGVNVDFQTLEASPNVFVMGSLTRGKHFYVSATDRVAAHASRVAKALTLDPFTKAFHVAIFIGYDFLSNLMVSKMVPELIKSGHVPYIFVEKQPEANKVSKLLEFEELSSFESGLFRNHVLPYLTDKAPEDAAYLTVRQMQTKYGILVEEVDEVNSVSFVARLAKHHIDLGIGLQFSEAFDARIKTFFSGFRRILELQATDNPNQYGTAAIARAAKTQSSNLGYSLHELTASQDMSRLVDMRHISLHDEQTDLSYTDKLCSMGACMTTDAIRKLANGEELADFRRTPPSQRVNSGADYGSQNFTDSGILPVDAANIVQSFVDSFASTKRRDVFQAHMLGVVRDLLSTGSL